jgi:hypothetical protein
MNPDTWPIDLSLTRPSHPHRGGRDPRPGTHQQATFHPGRGPCPSPLGHIPWYLCRLSGGPWPFAPL